MDCNVIRDLLPLYLDDCCSEESTRLVRQHLDACPCCKKTADAMKDPCPEVSFVPKTAWNRINHWKASVIQSVLLYVSFAVIVAGVILEGNTPAGPENGLWAVALIVPATASLLSLANWFFLRLYRSAKRFCVCSCLITLAMTVLGYVWAVVHYSGMISVTAPLVWVGVGLSLLFCLLSVWLSRSYARLLGRE